MGGGLLIAGLVAGYFIRLAIAARSANSLERRLKTELEETKNKAREIVLEAKDKAASLLDEIKNEERNRKIQLDRSEERLLKREESIENQVRDFRAGESRLVQEQDKLKAEKARLEDLQKRFNQELEKVAKLSEGEAQSLLLKRVEEQHRQDLASAIQKLEQQKKEEVEKRSLQIITTAIQRYARSHVAEVTTSVFHLKDEEMKGKIIGREGRNIRALERLTGVEIIIDETPETIVVSSFDPLRREIAKLSLEKLIKDGRIQPAKIEEKVEEAKQEINKRIQEIGEQAAFEVGVVDLPKEIIQLLGRLHFRTSYGQNVLVHSVEMAHIAGMIAAELRANADVAKRGALLHDIGKAISHEVEGTHVELGRKILKKYAIDEAVIQAMESHHEEYPFATTESFIVAAADVLSAARPGARRDTIENYLRRLEDLEKIAAGFEGVKNVYALSAGREIRVFVVPEKIDDFGALQLARDIAGKIQGELKYPGEIKVNVIRESRAVEYAK
ncbi:MAG: ribonuclease Y [Candidatus Harrisonbacteria bacterium RIFCSPHIGHO2_01_FULL_44_13]|uniref:Ribonuclease Y n=1 Tax=Candidatus Harrisonbacteria bacterium RIFCSPLOWO2_01_FULL_44_18 TaxID=1798407 RepID=A0A1G1ZNH3_9BACT|nr:MAG: ribonuclease Y [Candidatus Harrisonbacteria bacterium RIFCSPHIGHO2_01_FULL_44_13]OGY65397.1 MAG: ribonuclease Y [Candidatus Harrisonbacteria bacterium RIFCSPLOWO2_01_FULL_44_18]